MRKIVVIALLLMLAQKLMAQSQSDTAKIRFRSQNYAGLLEGDAGSSFQLLTINGVQYSTWFAGIGTGLDYYQYRSIPLFISLNKKLRRTGNSFYFLSDAGVNFVWKQTRQRSRSNDFVSDKFTPALYWNAGGGYKAMIGKKQNAILISLAYAYKRFKEKKETPVFCINPPCEPVVETYDYYLKRIGIRLGWEF